MNMPFSDWKGRTWTVNGILGQVGVTKDDKPSFASTPGGGLAITVTSPDSKPRLFWNGVIGQERDGRDNFLTGSVGKAVGFMIESSTAEVDNKRVTTLTCTLAAELMEPGAPASGVAGAPCWTATDG